MIGVVSSHGFGDILFNLPLIRTISQQYQQPIAVGVQPQCADAFYNIPWISQIIHVNDMYHGVNDLVKAGCNPVLQITQNIKFPLYKETDHNHSLIDTPALVGKELSLPAFDQRPIFIATPEESQTGYDYGQCFPKPMIAVECIAKSAQSWADQAAIDMIVNKYADTHRILWMSNQGAPNHHNVDNLLRYTRRQNIMLLKHCETFFSVGSGFFCASLALLKEHQPKRIVCLWIDDFYKYEQRLSQLQWHDNIVWVHNHTELSNAL